MSSSDVSSAGLIQGSDEWYASRCGKITASCFGKLAGKSRAGEGFTQTALTYMTQVVAERITGVPQDEIQSKYLDHGNRYESTARQLYQWHLKVRETLKQVGFVDHPVVPWCGGSPDCLVGDDGVLEIKCPYNVHRHLANIENDGTDDRDYIWQMQGNLWITGRQWCDFVSFHPFVPESLQFHVVRYARDEDIIDEIAERVPRAVEQVAIRVANIEKRVRLSAETSNE
jgi:putative phage-type endonuclease